MLYMITLPIILVILTLLIIIIKTYNCLDLFKNYSLDIANTKHLNNYLNSVHKNMYKIKLNKLELENNFKYHYLNSIDNVDPKYNSMLKQYIARCNFLLSELHIFKRYDWKFLISKNNLEMNMPFTIHDTIIIPETILNSLYLKYIRKQELSSSFINTLIHEKIHIVQRFNQKKFNKYYKSRYTFLAGRYKENLPETISKIHMNNPDSNNQIWTYKFNNELNYVLLKYNNHDTQSIGINIKNGNILDIDTPILKKQLGFRTDTMLYHPNEIFAYEVSKKIENKKLKNRDIQFIKSF